MSRNKFFLPSGISVHVDTEGGLYSRYESSAWLTTGQLAVTFVRVRGTVLIVTTGDLKGPGYDPQLLPAEV
jgi:hypothetical protein